MKTISIFVLAALLTSCASAGRTDASRGALLDPTGAAMTAPAPERFEVLFETSQGDFVVEANRGWAPNGVDRFYNLVRHGFYDGAYFFRVIPGFIAQFGIPPEPGLSTIWRDQRIPDDPPRESNRRGTLSFATRGPNTRTAQIFVNLADNPRLDLQGFTPIARVVEGMDVVDSLHAGYGEVQGPNQARIEAEGSAYLEEEFPRLDRIRRATVRTE